MKMRTVFAHPRAHPVLVCAFLLIFCGIAGPKATASFSVVKAQQQLAEQQDTTTNTNSSAALPPPFVPLVIGQIWSDDVNRVSSPKSIRTILISSQDISLLRWSSRGCRTSGAIQLESVFNNKNGFNQRKETLFTRASIQCDSQNITLQIFNDPTYVVPPDTGDLIQIKLAPTIASGAQLPFNESDYPLTFPIFKSPPLSSTVPESVWDVAYSIGASASLVGGFIGHPALVTVVPRALYLKTLATCGFETQFTIDTLQYWLRIPIGSSAFRFYQGAAVLNFVTIFLVLGGHCLILTAWARFRWRLRLENRRLEKLADEAAEQARAQADEEERERLYGGSKGNKKTGGKQRRKKGQPTEAEIRSAFKRFDADGSGAIDTDEMFTAMQALGFKHMTRPQVAEMVFAIDTDGNGLIDFDEFRAMMLSTEKGVTDAQLRQIFQRFDADGSGEIDTDEMHQAMIGLGYTSIDRAQVEGMIKSVDVDGNGLVDFDEFKTMMKIMQEASEKGGPEEVSLILRDNRGPPTFTEVLNDSNFPANYIFILILFGQVVTRSIVVVIWNSDTIFPRVAMGLLMVPWLALAFILMFAMIRIFPLFWDPEVDLRSGSTLYKPLWQRLIIGVGRWALRPVASASSSSPEAKDKKKKVRSATQSVGENNQENNQQQEVALLVDSGDSSTNKSNENERKEKEEKELKEKQEADAKKKEEEAEEKKRRKAKEKERMKLEHKKRKQEAVDFEDRIEAFFEKYESKLPDSERKKLLEDEIGPLRDFSYEKRVVEEQRILVDLTKKYGPEPPRENKKNTKITDDGKMMVRIKRPLKERIEGMYIEYILPQEEKKKIEGVTVTIPPGKEEETAVKKEDRQVSSDVSNPSLAREKAPPSGRSVSVPPINATSSSSSSPQAQYQALDAKAVRKKVKQVISDYIGTKEEILLDWTKAYGPEPLESHMWIEVESSSSSSSSSDSGSSDEDDDEDSKQAASLSKKPSTLGSFFTGKFGKLGEVSSMQLTATLASVQNIAGLGDPETFLNRLGPAFKHYKEGREWFLLLEIVLCIVYGVIEGLRNLDGCVPVAGIGLGIGFIYLVTLIVLRPFIAPIDHIFFIFGAVVLTVSPALMLVFHLDRAMVWAETIGSALAVAWQFLTILRALPLFYNAYLDFQAFEAKFAMAAATANRAKSEGEDCEENEKSARIVADKSDKGQSSSSSDKRPSTFVPPTKTEGNPYINFDARCSDYHQRDPLSCVLLVPTEAGETKAKYRREKDLAEQQLKDEQIEAKHRAAREKEEKELRARAIQRRMHQDREALANSHNAAKKRGTEVDQNAKRTMVAFANLEEGLDCPLLINSDGESGEQQRDTSRNLRTKEGNWRRGFRKQRAHELHKFHRDDSGDELYEMRSLVMLPPSPSKDRDDSSSFAGALNPLLTSHSFQEGEALNKSSRKLHEEQRKALLDPDERFRLKAAILHEMNTAVLDALDNPQDLIRASEKERAKPPSKVTSKGGKGIGGGRVEDRYQSKAFKRIGLTTPTLAVIEKQRRRDEALRTRCSMVDTSISSETEAASNSGTEEDSSSSSSSSLRSNDSTSTESMGREEDL